MYLYFLINNFHFALELFGAVVFLMAAWLTSDAYSVSKDSTTLFRAIGFGFVSSATVIHALNYGSDVLAYIGIFLFIFGLLLLLISFLKIKKLEVSSVLIIPAFSNWGPSLSGISVILLFAVSYLSFRQFKREFNKTWVPLSVAFCFLGFGLSFKS